MGLIQVHGRLVCQICGRAASSAVANHWLDEPHRFYTDVRVVRCPEHWSEWALRNTVAGRTEEMRARMRAARRQPKSPFPVYLDPFPMYERKE